MKARFAVLLFLLSPLVARADTIEINLSGSGNVPSGWDLLVTLSASGGNARAWSSPGDIISYTATPSTYTSTTTTDEYGNVFRHETATYNSGTVSFNYMRQIFTGEITSATYWADWTSLSVGYREVYGAFDGSFVFNHGYSGTGTVHLTPTRHSGNPWGGSYSLAAVAEVPEPSSALLLLVGAAPWALGLVQKRRRH